MTRPTAFTQDELPSRSASGGDFKPLQLRNVALHWVHVRRDHHYGAHRHDFYELIVPLRGTYHGALNGGPLAVRPGRLLFVQEGDRHEDFYRPGDEFAAMLFTLHDFGGRRWSQGVFAADAPRAARSVPLPPGSRLGALAALILAEGKARRHPSPAVEALVEAFLWLLTERLAPGHLSAPFRHSLEENAFRRRLFDCFARHLKESLRVADVAKRLGVSERSLDGRCRAVLGMSPARAYAAYRVREGARLLAGGMRVREAAAALGFADPFHFSKVFKRHLGYSPSRPATSPEAAARRRAAPSPGRR